MKPPVEDPASRARRPSTATSNSSRAASSLSPPRLTKRGGSPRTSDRLGRVDQAGGLVGDGAADGHPAGLDEGVGLLAGVDQAPPDQVEVEPPAGSQLLRRRLLGRGLAGRRLLRRGFLAAGFLAGALVFFSTAAHPLGQGVDIGLGGGLDLGQLLLDALGLTSVRMRSVRASLDLRERSIRSLTAAWASSARTSPALTRSLTISSAFSRVTWA